MSPRDYSATEMAAQLECIPTLAPHASTYSELERATFLWTIVYPQLTRAQSVFSSTRHKARSHRSDEKAVKAFHDAASELAKKMRRLGNVRLRYCEAKRDGETCGYPLVNGKCSYKPAHKR